MTIYLKRFLSFRDTRHRGQGGVSLRPLQTNQLAGVSGISVSFCSDHGTRSSPHPFPKIIILIKKITAAKSLRHLPGARQVLCQVLIRQKWGGNTLRTHSRLVTTGVN